MWGLLKCIKLGLLLLTFNAKYLYLNFIISFHVPYFFLEMGFCYVAQASLLTHNPPVLASQVAVPPPQDLILFFYQPCQPT